MTGPLGVLHDGTEVAAWVFKANPEVWDVEGHLARGRAIERWTLAPGYRGALLAAGHRAVLWLTGRRAGIIASGTVTGEAYEELDEEEERMRRWVPVHLTAVHPVRKDALLGDPRCRRLEMVRSARLGSASPSPWTSSTPSTTPWPLPPPPPAGTVTVMRTRCFAPRPPADLHRPAGAAGR